MSYPVIPDINTRLPLFRRIYYRKEWDSTYIPVGPLIYYCLATLIGYTFVNLGEYHNYNIFTSAFLSDLFNMTYLYQAFKSTIKISLAYFFISGIVCLKGQNNNDSEVTSKYYTFKYNSILWTGGFYFGLVNRFNLAQFFYDYLNWS